VRTDDDTAVARARTGDLDAYEVLVGRYTALAHRTAVLFGAGEEAPDVVQEAFVRAYRGLSGFRPGASFRPWLLRIVVNETRNAHRSRARRLALTARAFALRDSSYGQVLAPDVDVEAGEQRAAVLAAVRALPDKFRAVVTCRYLLELSEAETAALLGLPVGTVKSQLSRALARLHDDLAPIASGQG
jgi:RNA polymerase sigma-70 factor (ECF subfamily)